jgi:Asp-tRNA(Asn)/Glu-tRNA(Gln) amidotransferase A subunit family amidase
LKTAVEYDQIRAKSGKRNWTFEDDWNMDKYFPPLFGVPISIKDNIELEGTTSTVGLTIRANDIKKEDNLLSQAIKASGMIPFVKTNLPQLALNFDSNNFLWGRSLNPWNNKKSVGGSSGGEAAALAARVSLIGIGNDIGGSLRIPAAFCGVTSLMPGPGRLPKMGFYTYMLVNEESILTVFLGWI